MKGVSAEVLNADFLMRNGVQKIVVTLGGDERRNLEEVRLPGALSRPPSFVCARFFRPQGDEVAVDVEVVTTSALRGSFYVKFSSEEGTECVLAVELHVAQVKKKRN